MRNKERRRRDAERRAQMRRNSIDSKLRGELDKGAKPLPNEYPLRSLADAENIKKKKNVQRPQFSLNKVQAATLGTISSVVGSFGLIFAITATTPIFSGEWNPKGVIWLALCGMGIYSSIFFAKMSTKIGKFFTVAVGLLIATAFAAGVVSQVVVDGSAQIRGSVSDRSQKLATALINDMLIIEENQKFLELPDEQARGVYNLYGRAATQSAEIAAKWNPATNAEIPLPGFAAVLILVNGAADLQSRALIAFADDLNQPDPARKQEVLEMRDQINTMLSSEGGAARLLAKTVEPLGIVLTVEKGQKN